MARQIGLRDVYFAKITKDDTTGVTYATPVKIARAINAKISPKTATEKFYSDDSVEEVITNFDSIEIEVEVNQLTLASRALLQGITVGANGDLVETVNDIAPEGALLFRSKKSNGAYRYVVLYKGKFELVEDEYTTTTDSVDSKTPSLKGNFYARTNDGVWRYTIDSDEPNASQTKISAWFTTVQPPTGP